MDVGNASENFLIDPILPAHDISLISGCLGSGKSTLSLQLQRDWTMGVQIFGFEPVGLSRYAIFVACDRPLASIRSRMSRLGMDPEDFPHMSLAGKLTPRWDNRSVPAAVELALQHARAAQLVILDGLTVLCPSNINEDKNVAHFMCEAAEYCRGAGITVIGTVRSNKPGKNGTGPTCPQERIIGSTAWGATCQTFFDLSPVDPSDPTNLHRILSIIPRDTEPVRGWYKLKRTGLEKYDPAEDTLARSAPLDGWLAQQTPGVVLKTQEIMQAATQLGISDSSAERWLREREADSTLIRVTRGCFRVAERDPS